MGLRPANHLLHTRGFPFRALKGTNEVVELLVWRKQFLEDMDLHFFLLSTIAFGEEARLRLA